MMVCAHGNVVDFCKDRGMTICDTWSGDLREYRGACVVLVTDSDISEKEYYFLKGELLAKGYELISTRHKDDEGLLEFIMYANNRRREKSGGRQRFADEAVIRRIIELRSKGMSLRAIQADSGVCRPNGKKLSVSTISKIIERESEKKDG